MSAFNPHQSNVSQSPTTPTAPARPDYSWLFAAVETVNMVSAVYSLILGTVAFTFNPLSFIVLSRRAFKKSNVSVYLRCLTVTDSIGLVLIAVRYSTTKMYSFNVLTNDFFCSFYFYALNVSLYMSSWTLVVVSMERAIAIMLPHRVHIICTRNRAKLTMVLLALVWLGSMVFYPLLHTDLILTFGNYSRHYHCVMSVKSRLIADVITWFDNLFFAFLPAVIISVCSVTIVVGLWRSKKNLKALSGAKGSNTKGETTDSGTVDVEAVEQPDKKGKQVKTSKESAMTRTVLAINACFMVCNFPFCIYVFLPGSLMGSNDNAEVSYQLQKLSTAILLLLVYTNNALNFAMYIATGSKFRKELISLFRESFGRA